MYCYIFIICIVIFLLHVFYYIIYIHYMYFIILYIFIICILLFYHFIICIVLLSCVFLVSKDIRLLKNMLSKYF